VIYSPSCGYHAVTTYKGFYSDKVNGQVTQRDMLAEAIDAIEKG